MSECTHCQALARENQRLLRELEKALKLIKRLKETINAAKATCAAIIGEADSIMSKHQSRGVWAFAKGARQAAYAILNSLG